MQRILKICQQSVSGGDSLEEPLVNSGAPEIVVSSSIEATGPLLNGRTIKMHS